MTGVLFGRLGAEPEPRRYYEQLTAAPEFSATVSWDSPDVTGFDGLLLPGGHAPGMRQYLGSAALQRQVARFWGLERSVGAICHGVLVLARTRDAGTGCSVLAGHRTTCLPKCMERTAYLATAWRLGRCCRTCPAYVEDEVRSALTDPDALFERGPRELSPGAAPPRTTGTRSWPRTAAMSRRAGQGTRISSRGGSSHRCGDGDPAIRAYRRVTIYQSVTLPWSVVHS
ncbi:type 1 glutamine amidotransferase domain-containing protein [Streptomyces caeni]|uniref:Type 1 glutamine amidotransferase domain-containing protein n=1 Tax=Streptomyces caeni TaxID=2307231 RepID=A0ABW4IK67_9ACTN